MKRTSRKIQLVLVPALAMGLLSCSNEPAEKEDRYSCVDESGVVVDERNCEGAYANGHHSGMSPFFWYWMGRGSMGIGQPRFGERVANFSPNNLRRSFPSGAMPRRGGFGTSSYGVGA